MTVCLHTGPMLAVLAAMLAALVRIRVARPEAGGRVLVFALDRRGPIGHKLHLPCHGHIVPAREKTVKLNGRNPQANRRRANHDRAQFAKECLQINRRMDQDLQWITPKVRRLGRGFRR
jgi:hypothetical protein